MSVPDQPSAKSLDIRKYPNRRYYDATHSRHLTLEEIRVLIRDGFDLKVTDSKTGADITAQVLTQIILELETPKIDTFPVALLLQMIRSNDQIVRDFVERYFNQAFSAYLDYQKQMEERLRQMQGVSGLFPPFGTWAQSVMPSFGAPFSPTQPAEPRPTPEPPPAAENSDLRSTVTKLQRQIAALQAGSRRGKAKRGRR